MLVRIRSKLEMDGPWSTVDGWSFAELEILPRVGEYISLQHVDGQGVWLRVDHIVHTPNNVKPISASDERPYQAILFVTWVESKSLLLGEHRSGTYALPPNLGRPRRRWRQ